MSVRQSRNLLLIAFAISLLLHLIFALNFHRRGSESPTDIEVVRIEHRSIMIRVQKTPPPRAHPKQTPAPTSSPAPKPTASGSKPAGNGAESVATSAPTPAPTAAATVATNPCGRNDAEAALATPPTPPVIPVSARGDGTSGTTIVKGAARRQRHGAGNGRLADQRKPSPRPDRRRHGARRIVYAGIAQLQAGRDRLRVQRTLRRVVAARPIR